MPLERANVGPAIKLQFRRVREVVRLTDIQEIGTAVLPREYVVKSEERPRFEFQVVVKGSDGGTIFEGVMMDPTGIELEAPHPDGDHLSSKFDRVDGASLTWEFFVLIPNVKEAHSVELYSRPLNRCFHLDDNRMINGKPFSVRRQGRKKSSSKKV